jgi:hypothetical protein
MVVTFYITDFQYYSFFLSHVPLQKPSDEFLVTLVLYMLIFFSGVIFIGEKNGGWRLIYALTLPLAFLASYELVSADSFQFTSANVWNLFPNQTTLYVTALLVLVTGSFFLATYRRFNIYYVLLGIGAFNVFVAWLAFYDPNLASLRSILPIVPILLIGFTSLKFWHYSAGALLLFFLALAAFVFWIFVEQSPPSTFLSLALIIITKTLIALFFASLLDSTRKQS